MQLLLDALTASLSQSDAGESSTLIKQILLSLTTQNIHCVSDYPVAIDHDKVHLQENNSLLQLQTIAIENKVRKVDLMIVSDDVQTLTFTAKRPQDFWKRLSSVEHIQAMVSFLSVPAHMCQDTFINLSIKQSNKGQWSVETQLRDAMRANKENRDLGKKPFIMIMCKEIVDEPEDHIEQLLKHYFNDNLVSLVSKEKKLHYYLAYNEHMGDIGMRYFYRFNL